MKSLERRFKNIERLNPYWSSYICFAMAVDGQKFSHGRIGYWFKKLVNKDDYARNEKTAIVRYLKTL